MNFNLNKAGVPPTKSTYDHESAINEILYRMETQERLESVILFIDKTSLPFQMFFTNFASRSKVNVHN